MKKNVAEPIDWLFFEREAAQAGCALVCGVDEAGRGPLAGPVYAAAVILPQGKTIEGVNDSKKLTEKKREALFDVICREAAAYSIGTASVEEIDALNILQATFLAMRRAVEGLGITPELALVDGNQTPAGLKVPVKTIIGGDAKCASIAAASILAKVSRDRYMTELDRQYPGYGLAKHKGYGTKAHTEALRTLGPSPVHRRTFLTKILAGTPFAD